MYLHLEARAPTRHHTRPPPPQPPKPPPPPSPPALSRLTLTGIIDGLLSGGRPKAAEVYAHCDVPIAEYGLAKSTNGGGTGGEPGDARRERDTEWFGRGGSFFFVATEAVV